MKNRYTFSFLLIFLCYAGIVQSFAQNGQNSSINRTVKVARGERPAINLESIPKESIEKRYIRVKFIDKLGDYLSQCSLKQDAMGGITFGLQQMDALNKQYGVTDCRRTFYIALENTEYNDRHRAWGLDLWFDLFIPDGTDILAMVHDYQTTPDIAFAEPVFRKGVACDLIAKDYEPTAGNDSPDFTPNDTRFNEQWHYHNTGQEGGTVDADIDLPEAWELAKGNADVVVAIVDAGIAYSHPDLSGNMWPGIGWDFATNSPTIVAGAHGTHVAGTVAANTNNNTGVSGVAGGNGTGNGVRLMSCQIANSAWNQSGGFENAFVWSADHGAAISQNSWAYNVAGAYEQVVLDAIDYFNANGGGKVMAGGLTICAAGNSNSQAQLYPAYYSGCISVAATNNQDKRASYSTYNTGVDLSAPGGDGSGNGRVMSTWTSNLYGFLSGTSMAAPHVSGVAALIISAAPGQLTASQVRTILTTTTDNIDLLNPLYVGKMGSGRLNANNAVTLAQTYINPSIVLPPSTFSASAVATNQVNLSWTKNGASDPVLLAYNTSYTFGTPSGSYTVGDPIAGGGAVLYEGSLTSFNHTLLNPNTAYFYSLWSKNGSTYSLISLKSNDTTSATLPFSESFNGASFPANWTQTRTPNADQSWYISNSNYAGGSAREIGSFYQNVTSGTMRLVTPPISTLGFSKLALSFKHILYAYGIAETIKIQSSTNGITWTDESWTVTSSTNVGPATVSTYINNNLNNLTTYLAFTISGNLTNYYWFLDDISVTVLNTWGGGAPTISPDWNTAANWSLNQVPTSAQSVRIPTGTAHVPQVTSVVATPAVCQDLIVDAGALLYINEGKALTVNGTISNNAGVNGLWVKSSAAGTGSLLHRTPDVPMTIARHITGNPDLTQYDYHLVSVPMAISNNSTAALFMGCYLYNFSVGANAWNSLGTSTSTSLDETKGYMIYYPGAQTTLYFQGNMNGGSFSPSVFYSGSGFNLVPNPYPSAIDWDAVSGWTKSNLSNATWIWPAGGANYAAYVNGVGTNGGTRYIPGGQAFFVMATGPGSVLTMDFNTRLHHSQPFWKTDPVASDLLRIKVIGTKGTDEAVVRFTSAATTFVDDDWDAPKMPGLDGAPQLSTLSGEVINLSINTLPLLSDGFVVPLQFVMNGDESCTMEFTGIESFRPSTSIWLEDKLTAATVDILQQRSYTFSHQSTNDENRFNLHFNGLTGVDEPNSQAGKIWYHQGQLYLRFVNEDDSKATVDVYNVLGQKLQSTSVSLNGITSVKMDKKGLLLVKVKLGTKELVTKIVAD